MANQGNKKYSKLIASAEGLFWKYGFSGVTMDEIAKVSGISKATIYNYITSKEDLLMKVLFNSVDHHLKIIMGVLDKHYHTLDKIESLFSYSTEMAKGISAILIKDITQRPKIMEEITEYKTKKIYHIWEKILADGIEKGEIRELDVDFASKVLLHIPLVLMKMDYISEDGIEIKLYEKLFDFIKYGLLGGLDKA